MLENGVKTQPKLSQAPENCRGLEMSRSHNAWCGLYLPAARSSSSTINTRSVLIRARSSGGPSGTKDSFQSLRWKGSSAKGSRLRDNSEGGLHLVSSKTLDEHVSHYSNGLPEPGSHHYTLLGVYQHGV